MSEIVCPMCQHGFDAEGAENVENLAEKKAKKLVILKLQKVIESLEEKT